MGKRLFIIVLDSLGIGELPDAADFGDVGSNTLRAIAHSKKFQVPNLQALGLFNIAGIDEWCASPAAQPTASFARMVEQSRGKDTTIGHWELAGIVSPKPLPLYPDGFPEQIIHQLEDLTFKKILCNKPYSGTQVLRDYGREHIRTLHSIILYTSADSVMQIAAHEQHVPVKELYEICDIARRVMQGEHAVGRIIARPFVGDPPDFVRTSNRHDVSLPPPGTTMLDVLSRKWLDVIGVGKIYDIFSGHGITRTIKTKDNNDGMEQTIRIAQQNFTGLCFVNLVDFDMLYGHRNDVDGYAAALTAFDRQLPELMKHLQPDDAVILTADHGCDPSTPSTDHSREYVPMVMFGPKIRPGVNLGTRATFADISATAQDYFDLPVETSGTSFYPDVRL